MAKDLFNWLSQEKDKHKIFYIINCEEHSNFLLPTRAVSRFLARKWKFMFWEDIQCFLTVSEHTFGDDLWHYQQW